MLRQKSYIEELISQGEGQQLDFKFNISDSRKIARSISAFANAQGGTLLIGVKDNGAIAGIRSDEELFMLEAATEMYLKPTPEMEHEVWDIEKKTILEVKINEGGSKPYLAQDDNGKWLAYIRWNDQNILANRVLLKYWQRMSAPRGTFFRYTRKEKYLLDYLKENQSVTLSKAKNMLNIPLFITENIVVALLSLGILRFEIHEGKFLYFLNENQTDSKPEIKAQF